MTGTKRICINDDPTRVIEFDPTEEAFAKRYFAMVRVCKLQYAKFTARLMKDKSDEGKQKVNNEICAFMSAQVDGVFGPGTSETAFNNELSISAFTQFFSGITPIITANQPSGNKKLSNHKRSDKGSRQRHSKGK